MSHIYDPWGYKSTAECSYVTVTLWQKYHPKNPFVLVSDWVPLSPQNAEGICYNSFEKGRNTAVGWQK